MRLGLKTVIGGVALGAALSAGTLPAAALGPDDYIGAIGLVAFSFCPEYTMEAVGQTLLINDYQALFALVGWQYGGDGRTTFALPDLRDKVPVDGMRYCIVYNGVFPPRS